MKNKPLPFRKLFFFNCLLRYSNGILPLGTPGASTRMVAGQLWKPVEMVVLFRDPKMVEKMCAGTIL